MFVSVKGKVVLIFGGSSGIGKALANRFCKEGAAVVATYFSTKTNEVAEMLEDNFRYCDIRHPSELNSVCEYTREKYGRIDIAINCAGITDDAEIEEMTADQWEKVISINLTGTMNFLKVASSYMKCSGGKVFVLSSSQGKAARTRQANYVASKAGVSQICIVAAKELAKYNIHVNVICPGFIETELNKNHPEKRQAADYLSLFPTENNLVDLINCVLFLSSDLVRGITGQIFTIDSRVFGFAKK